MRAIELEAFAPARLGALLSAVNAETGSEWTVERKFEGGSNGGAHLVRSGQGVKAVLKVQISDPDLLLASDKSVPSHDRTIAAAVLVATARTAGWPTPAWHAMGATPAGEVWVLQQFVEGGRPDRIDASVADQLVAVFELQAGLIRTPVIGWGEWISRVLFDNGDGLRRRVRTLPRGEDLVRRVDAIARDHADVAITGRDLVHGDMNLTNTLATPGGLWIIDVETIGSGPRVYDLIKTLMVAGILDLASEEGLDRLWAYAATFDRGEFALCSGAAALTVAESIVRHDLQSMAPSILGKIAMFLDRALSLPIHQVRLP